LDSPPFSGFQVDILKQNISKITVYKQIYKAFDDGCGVTGPGEVIANFSLPRGDIRAKETFVL
jgi:hypothetical protein